MPDHILGASVSCMETRRITAADTRPIREVVLRPGLPASESIYPGDDAPSTIHLGVFEEGTLLGVATFMLDPCPTSGGESDWRLRGMATLARARNRGLGGRLLADGIERVRVAGGRLVWCNGRVTARAFYERHDFRAVGEAFESPHSGWHFLFVRDL